MSDIGKEVHNPKKSNKLKPGKDVNLTNNKVLYDKNMKNAGNQLGVHYAAIRMICNKIPGHKTSTSKKDGCKYKFEYIDDHECERRMADKEDDKIVVRINSQNQER